MFLLRKTYTMLGLPSDLSNPTAQSRGIIPQLVQAIFARISERMATETGVNIDVGVESLEIYNGATAAAGGGGGTRHAKRF